MMQLLPEVLLQLEQPHVANIQCEDSIPIYITSDFDLSCLM